MANTLAALFGTPDEPFIFRGAELGTDEVLNIELLRLAAGPVGSDQASARSTERRPRSSLARKGTSGRLWPSKRAGELESGCSLPTGGRSTGARTDRGAGEASATSGSRGGTGPESRSGNRKASMSLTPLTLTSV